MNSAQPQESALTMSDKRTLGLIKLLIGLIVIGLVVGRAQDLSWPLTTWTMYKVYGARPPAPEASSTQLRIVNTSGDSYIVWPDKLYTAVSRRTSDRAISDSFAETDAHLREQDFAMLLARARALLPEVDIAEIQGWSLMWNVELTTSPPFDLNHPDKEVLLGSFRVSDYPVFSEDE